LPRTFGGTRNGTIVHWPNGFKARGEIRRQFHHIIDVAATVLDAAGLPEPTLVNGIQQMPLHGVSMTYAFDDAEAPEARETQLLRGSLQPRDLSQGLGRRYDATASPGDRRW
jgi:arylsulfatase A-like enzyme